MELTTLIATATVALGLSALMSTDPVVMHKFSVPYSVEYSGYSGDLVPKLLRAQIRKVALAAGTRKGDNLSIYAEDMGAIEILAEQFHLEGAVDAIQEFFDLHQYSLSGHVTESDTGLTLTVKAESSENDLFILDVSGGHDMDVLIQRMAEEFIGRVDPYVLALYHFRKEYPHGPFDKSLPILQHSVDVLPLKLKTWPLNVWGRVLYAQGDYEGAIEKYKQALAIDPAFFFSMGRWGEALWAMGDHAGGLERMQRAVNMPGAAPAYYEMLGQMLQELDRDVDARAVYVDGLRAHPDHAGLQKALGALYLAYGQAEPAVRLLQKAYQSGPDDPTTLTLLRQALDAATHPTHAAPPADRAG